jgi:pimeloyl-ACP methyl ester carboxylesterase
VNLMTLGTARRSLFAVHDPAVAGTARARAAVICNPLGIEYVYAHRSLRHLALRLARRGFDTVRFDYYGTGDSAGSDEEANVADMHSDVDFAIEAARDIKGARRVTLVGLRDGAAIAARAAMRKPADIDALVLWDPVDPPVLSPEVSARTLLIATHDGAASEGAVMIPAPCCWVESITTSGALPVAVFQRIEEWLR